MTRFIFAVLFGSLTTSLAFADQMGPHGDKFYEEAAHYENFCKDENSCQGEYRNEVVYSLHDQINKIGFANAEELKKISFDQAQIWGDTILEGDYVSEGQTRLDRALALYKNKDLIGYKVQYSEKGWYTGNCNYDGHEDSLVDCDAGRIIEVSYVSADLQTYFVDENQSATFAFDKK